MRWSVLTPFLSERGRSLILQATVYPSSTVEEALEGIREARVLLGQFYHSLRGENGFRRAQGSAKYS
jgi:hypothetical protein